MTSRTDDTERGLPEDTFLNSGNIMPPKSLARGVAEEAHKLIHGERRKSYGPVEKSFDDIAKLINFMFPKNSEISGKDFAIIMICMKLCRERNAHSRDNLVDICGYADLLQQLYDAEPKT